MGNYLILSTHWFEFIKFGILFYLAVFLCFTIPGSFLSKYFRVPPLINLVIATIFGMIICSWEAYIVGAFGLRVITPYLILSCFLYWIKTKGYQQLPKITDLLSLKNNLFYWFVGLCGLIFLLTPLIVNGISTEKGVLFCCTSDSFWYLGLTQEIINKFPPDTPGLNGVPLTNYHFFYNLMIAEMVRVFNLPLAPTIFQYSRVLFALLYVLSGLILIRKLSDNQISRRIFFFFLFFGSDFAHVIGFFFTGKINLNYTSIYLSQMSLFNMPMGIATILLFTTLFLLLQSKKSSSFIKYSIIGFLAGTILGFKTHMGLSLIFGIVIYSLIECLSTKSYKPLALIAAACITGTLIFLPTNSNTGGLYPSWFFQIEQGMKNPLFEFDQQKLEYISYWTKKGRLFTLPITQISQILLYEVYFAIIYIIGFFGTTLLGIFQIFKTAAHRAFHFMLVGMLLLSIVLGMFFLQTTGVGHTYNFLIVAYLLAQVFASLALGALFKGKKWVVLSLIILVFVVLVNISRTMQSLLNYTSAINNENLFVLSKLELEAFNFLQAQNDVEKYVLVDPDNFLNYVTPYISVFINHPLYYSGEYIVSALNLKYQERKNIAYKLKNSNEPNEIINIMLKENIGYIYVKKPDSWNVFRGGNRVFKSIFSNDLIDIFTLVNR